MKSISEITKQEKPKLSKSERTQIIKEIYERYSTFIEKSIRRDANIERYKIWLRENRFKHSKLLYVTFSRTKFFIRELSSSTFAIMLSHIKSKDLYFIRSECFDRNNRNQSIGAYVMSLRKKNGEIKTKPTSITYTER